MAVVSPKGIMSGASLDLEKLQVVCLLVVTTQRLSTLAEQECQLKAGRPDGALFYMYN